MQKNENISENFRIYGLFFLIFIFSLAIIARLHSVQVSTHDYYKGLAENQHSIFKNLFPERGEIFLKDKEGLYPVAVNKKAQMAYAIPKEIENPFAAAFSIAKILNLDENELKDKLNQPEDGYEVLKHYLNDEEADKIKELNLKGIRLSDETYRYYPAGELASHALGFVGWKDDDFGGRYGLEAYFEKELKGEEGKLSQKKDSSGRWISTGKKEISYAKNGDDLVLTIDHIIQYETEKLLRGAVEKYKADRGMIIVMESKTGKILSLANYPNFNPNNYRDVQDMANFRNLTVSDAYECGSVFKAITLASAVDNKKINYNTQYVDTGQVVEAGYVMKNSDLKAYGQQTMTQVLEKSLNTGAIYAEKLLGNKNFSDYVKRFGFGEITGIELPGESAGDIANLKNLKINIQFFTASFGQGITVTPMQLVSAYNSIASGGILMKPQIVEKIIYEGGQEKEIKPQEIRRVITQQAANEISQMLGSVVVNGHGKRAGVPGYLVAGKTGTAQVASQDKKGYEKGKNIGSFAGFAPLNDPRFTVLVRIDNPKEVEWAESSAAPVFGELMKFLLNYGNIKQTENYTQADLNLFDQTHTLNRFLMEKEKEEKDKKKKEEETEKEKENIN